MGINNTVYITVWKIILKCQTENWCILIKSTKHKIWYFQQKNKTILFIVN